MIAPITKIKYLNKTIQEMDENGIKLTAYTYEIDEEGMMLLAAFQNETEFEIRRIFLYQEGNNTIDLVVDNIPDGRVLYGGIKDGKFILCLYKVHNGLDKLLELLSSY